MDLDVPDEPLVSMGDSVTPDDQNAPVGRLADAYNRDDEKVFVKPVKRGSPPENPEHYYPTHSGYAISKDVLDKLRLHRVETVFILERDTDLVLEHNISDFKYELNDGVYCANETEAKYRWPDLGFDLFTNDTLWGK